MKPTTCPVVFFLVFSFVFSFGAESTLSGEQEGAERPELYTVDGVYKKNGWLGPTDIAISPDGGFLYVLASDAWEVRKIDPEGENPPVVLEFDFRPERMCRFEGGEKLAVVGGGVRGRLAVVETGEMKIVLDVALGHSPSDVAVFTDEDRQIAYVSNRFGGDISVVDLVAGKETERWDAGREPIALAITNNGKKLIVAAHLPEGTSLDPKVACNARIFDTKTGAAKIIPLRGGTVNARDVIISPGGRYAFITAQIGHFEQVPTSVDGGWMNENILSIVDLKREEYADSFFLDDFGRGAANPWGITVSNDGKYLAVALSGCCEIIFVNLPGIIEFLDREPRTQLLGQGSGYFHSTEKNSLPMRLRVPMGIRGMRHLVFDRHKIYCTCYFEDSIASCVPEITEPLNYIPGYVSGPHVKEYPKRTEKPLVIMKDAPLRFESLDELDLFKGAKFERAVARLAPEPLMNIVRKGEMIFHDATRCYEQWQSCVSCHPDGRSDTLNWDLLNDGMGNPKNTKSMLYSHETPPSMASGVRKDAETAVRSGVKSILFAEIKEDEALAMDEYLKALRPVPSPYLVDGNLSEAARRGKRIFESDRSGCADCHPGPFFTDQMLHDVGTRSPVDTFSKFDTPTLIETWRTAPYLHDGRYRTMKEVITEGKHFNNRGQIDKLSEREIDDLVEYVLSL